MASADAVELHVSMEDNVDDLIFRIEATQPLIVDVAAEEIIAQIRRSIDSRSGHLADSIEVLQREGSTVWIGTKLYYAPWVEHGTLIHVIGPTKKRRVRAAALGKQVAIQAPDWSHPVLATIHPGAAAHPFMRLGKERSRRILPERVGQILRRELGLR